jgi:hypothetical protein
MASGIAIAQVEQNSDLFKNLKAKDSILLKIGFNKFEIEKRAVLMTKYLELYHDKGGVLTYKEAFVNQMKDGLSKPNNPKKVYRFLVKES